MIFSLRLFNGIFFIVNFFIVQALNFKNNKLDGFIYFLFVVVKVNMIKIKNLEKCLGVVLALNSGGLFAENITVLNGNYESDAVPLDTRKTTFISGWVDSGFGDIGVEVPQDGDVDYTGYPGQGQSAYLTAGGRLSQTFPTTVRKDEKYILTYRVGRPLDQLGHSFVARFKADGLVLAQLQTNTADVVAGTWETKSLSFTATEDMPLNMPLVVEFYNLTTGAGHRANLDDVSLVIAGTGVDTPLSNNIENVVISDTTLNVPEDFSDINAALNFLDEKVFEGGSTMTIQVNNCYTTTYENPIEVKHPQGQQIQIIGNTTNPQSCPLRFNGSHGVIVSDNGGLGLINGFYLYGDDTANTVGIWVNDGAKVNVGDKVRVHDFDTGVLTEGRALLYGDSAQVYGNVSDGFTTRYGSYVSIPYAVSHDNGGDGMDVTGRSYVYWPNANIQNNDGHGYSASNGSSSYLYNSSIFGNSSSGVAYHRLGYLSLLGNGGIKNNAGFGVEASQAAFVIFNKDSTYTSGNNSNGAQWLLKSRSVTN